MSVSPLSSATGGTAAQTVTQQSVSKDEFLLLFVTQLQNQDPLSPMDSTGFTAQLAQFSSLEQLTSINDGIAALAASQNSLQNAYLSGIIGKQVGYEGAAAEDGTVATVYGTVTGISFDTDATYLVVDGTTKVALGDIKEIK